MDHLSRQQIPADSSCATVGRLSVLKIKLLVSDTCLTLTCCCTDVSVEGMACWLAKDAGVPVCKILMLAQQIWHRERCCLLSTSAASVTSRTDDRKEVICKHKTAQFGKDYKVIQTKGCCMPSQFARQWCAFTLTH